MKATLYHDDGRIRHGFRQPGRVYQMREALLDWLEDRGVEITEELKLTHPDELARRALDIQPLLTLRLKKAYVRIEDARA